MISIIIPTLNEESAISKTLISLKQLSLPHEIIVSDGGSTDATIAKVQALGHTAIIHPKDKRQTTSSNRNNGAQHAQGEILVFIDSDCSIPDIDTVFNKCLEYFNDKNIVAVTVWVKTQPDLETFADKVILGFFNYIFLFMNNVVGIGAAAGKFQMIRKDVFVQLGGYREDLVAGEDHDMFKRLSKVGKTKMDSSLIVYHSNRRAHKIGWPKLLWIWAIDTVAIMFKGKAKSKEWTPIR
jgi:glycosyltransferase involved in cell wall biosynthesis